MSIPSMIEKNPMVAVGIAVAVLAVLYLAKKGATIGGTAVDMASSSVANSGLYDLFPPAQLQQIASSGDNLGMVKPVTSGSAW